MSMARFALAASLTAGLCGYATGASAGGDNPRLQDEFFVNDTHDLIQHNFAYVSAVDNVFSVSGEVESHEGTETDGAPDTVRILYRADQPNHAQSGDTAVNIKQHGYSELRLIVNSNTPARNLDVTVYPRKCSIDAKVNAPKEHARVTTKCSGTDIFADATEEEVASILQGFASARDVKIKVKSNGKATLKILNHGTAVTPVEDE